MHEIKEKNEKIEDPHRISRILSRMEAKSVPIFLRTNKESTSVIKATGVEKILSPRTTREEKESPSTLCLYQISTTGLNLLKKEKNIIVEASFGFTKIIFNSDILTFEENRCLLLAPKSIQIINRRKNERFNTSSTSMSFLFSPILEQCKKEPSPNTYPQFENLKNCFFIQNISHTGLGLLSYEELDFSKIETLQKDPSAKISLPMKKPITVPLVFRWKKKVNYHLKELNTYETKFLVGCEFLNTNSELEKDLAQYIMNITDEGTI